MSKLTPIIKICTWNKPCFAAKIVRTRSNHKTHIRKLCTFKDTCNQQHYKTSRGEQS